MTEQVVTVEAEPKQRKPRTTKTAMNVVFKLEGDSLRIFRELLKTFQDAIGEDLPIEIYPDKLILRGMDVTRIKMANFVLDKAMFEEWDVANRTKDKPAALPIRIKIAIADLIYSIEDASKDAKARFDIGIVFSTYGRRILVVVRKPHKCPKCGRATDYNMLPQEKRGKKMNRYKCACGWRGKVRKWERKERVVTTEITSESKITVEVIEQLKESYNIKILTEEVPDIPPLPIIHYDANFKIEAGQFKKKLVKIQKRAECFKIAGSKDEIVVSGQGDMIDMSVTIEKGDMLLVADANGVSTATYSLKEVLATFPEGKVAQIIAIQYTTDKPMRVTWQIDALGRACVAEFYVAPRLEVE